MSKDQKSSRPSFADFKPRVASAASASAHDPASFAGLSPQQAAAKVAELARSKADFEELTLNLKEGICRRLLTLLGERQLDLASARAEDMATLREYLRELVERKEISESYAALNVNQWNATMRLLFGTERAKVLTMRGFRQFPKKVQHVTEADMSQIRQAILDAPSQAGSMGLGNYVFNNEHYRRVFYAYWELAQSTGCRYGSAVKIRADDLDLEQGTVRFRHMKNVENRDHRGILTPRATRVLGEWVQFIKAQPWYTPESAILAGPNGRPISAHFVNKTLKTIAVRVGLTKPLSSHKIRASVGTIIGRENPKLAALQLGITDRIFNRHYNQPTLEDRMARRDLLPGFEGEGQAPLRPEHEFLPRPIRRNDFEVA